MCCVCAYTHTHTHTHTRMVAQDDARRCEGVRRMRGAQDLCLFASPCQLLLSTAIDHLPYGRRSDTSKLAILRPSECDKELRV